MASERITAERLELHEAIKSHDIALGLARIVRLAEILELPDTVTAELVETFREKLHSIDRKHHKVARLIGKAVGSLEPHEVVLTGETSADSSPEPVLTLKTMAVMLHDIAEPAPAAVMPMSAPTSNVITGASRDRSMAYDPEPEVLDHVYQPWMHDALCSQVDPEAFFPEKGGSTREAKRICAACDVSEQCLHYALENDERFGIWGGKSERERRKILKTSADTL